MTAFIVRAKTLQSNVLFTLAIALELHVSYWYVIRFALLHTFNCIVVLFKLNDMILLWKHHTATELIK